MKRYIKPATEITEIEIQNHILEASGNGVDVLPGDNNEIDRAKDKGFSFNVWGDDEE